MLTPEQEVYLAKIADAGLLEEARAVKLAAIDAAQVAAEAKILPQYLSDIQTKTGTIQKQAITDLRAAIASDSEVAKLKAELAAL